MEKLTVYTLKLTPQQESKLLTTFSSDQTTPPPYAKWQCKVENCTITCYESHKTVFQGKDAYIYASPFLKEEEPIKQTKKVPTYPQAGSDEVGTGDYFGPVCVCATYVTEETLNVLQECGVRDSKQLKDVDILKIAPLLMKKIPYSLLILDNEKYNKVHDTNNMNAIKAKMHNQAYVNLSKKIQLPSFMIIDQFTPEKLYYAYIKNEPNIIRGIHFETKAEDKYPSVGAGSVIARYAFLKKMEEMEEKYHMSFQKGASAKVDACAQDFIDQFGFEELHKVAKIHFKNTENLQK